MRMVIVNVAFAVLLALGTTYADDRKVAQAECGGATVDVVGNRYSEDPPSNALKEVTLTVQIATKKIELKFDEKNSRGEYFHVACIVGQKRQPYVVFQNYCGGSGCRDLDNYGIIDPRTLKVLLMPDDTNRKRAAKILGSEPPHLLEDKRRFF